MHNFYLKGCSYQLSQPGKWDEHRQVRSRNIGEKNKSAILDLTIWRSDLAREFGCLVTFLIEILAKTPYICYAFQIKFFPARKKLFCSFTLSLSCLSRWFSMWMRQKTPSWYLSQPTYRLPSQFTSHPLNKFTTEGFSGKRPFMHLCKHVFQSQYLQKYLSYEAHFFQNVPNLMYISKMQ